LGSVRWLQTQSASDLVRQFVSMLYHVMELLVSMDMMLIVFLQMQDLRSQLQELIPEQQVCYSTDLSVNLVKPKSFWGI
jgi:hypothetical protein